MTCSAPVSIMSQILFIIVGFLGIPSTAPLPYFPASPKDRGPKPEMYSGIGSSKLTNPLSGMMCRIAVGPSGVSRILSSPFNNGESVSRYRSNSLIRCGGCPITRKAVLPAPTPRNVLFGAIALIVAMLAAVTGAGRVPEIATPVPRRI